MYLVKVQFPPRVTVGEIVQKQLNNNIKNANHTVNSFMIYRREFNREIRESRFNFKLKEISKLAAVSWKTEPQYIKDHYKRMAKDNVNTSNTSEDEFIVDSNTSLNTNYPYSSSHSFTPLNHPSQNYAYDNVFIGSIATSNNISLNYYSSLTPLLYQPSQYIVSNDVISVNDYPYFYSYTPFPNF
ncbi:9825_t:CDS:2 [Diversispora eburnea]|uniref:9825_t:CDS:1 n=1 Tax=Diversispora eburnea TaxID=1213867 RepID=A0A9N9B5G0_9GLOM|nr:9825_t:CDS:2 [Diversispora eburnea]